MVADELQRRAQAITDAANAMKFLGKTPLSESVRRAAAELKSTEAKATVILITDGWQYCVPYDATTRFDGVAAAAALQAQGVTVWVVGFGSEVDTAALNQMAVAAGTAKAGCNPQSTDPAAPGNPVPIEDDQNIFIDDGNQIA